MFISVDKQKSNKVKKAKEKYNLLLENSGGVLPVTGKMVNKYRELSGKREVKESSKRFGG